MTTAAVVSRVKPVLESPNLFQIHRTDDLLLVEPQGDVPGFRDADLQHELTNLLRLVESLGVRKLLVDLGGTEYFGSAMIGAIFELRRQVVQDGGRAALCNASPQMHEVLQVLKVDREWPYFETREAAIEALSE